MDGFLITCRKADIISKRLGKDGTGYLDLSAYGGTHSFRVSPEQYEEMPGVGGSISVEAVLTSHPKFGLQIGAVTRWKAVGGESRAAA